MDEPITAIGEDKSAAPPMSDGKAVVFQLGMIVMGLVLAFTVSPLAFIPLGLLVAYRRELAPEAHGGFRYASYHLAFALSLGLLLVVALIFFLHLFYAVRDGIQQLATLDWKYRHMLWAYPFLFGGLMALEPSRFGARWWIGVLMGWTLPWVFCFLFSFMGHQVGEPLWLRLGFPAFHALIPLCVSLVLGRSVQAGAVGIPSVRLRLLIYGMVAFALIQQQGAQWGTDPFVKRLPSWTLDYRTWNWIDPLLGDETFLLKAKVTEAEFMAYVEELEMKPAGADFPIHWDNTGPVGWDLEPTMEGTYLKVQDTSMPLKEFTRAKYQGGYLYLEYSNS